MALTRRERVRLCVLKALLYGIDERTLDNFIHATISSVSTAIYGIMMIVSSLWPAQRPEKYLLSPDGEALDEQALTPFLQGVTPELFESLFGIDHQALVQEGNEILEQKGEVGQALFSASLGSHALHAVLGDLDDSAKNLFFRWFKAADQLQPFRTHADLRAEIRKCSLSSREWDEHRRTLARTEEELKRIQAELADNRTEINRFTAYPARFTETLKAT